MQKIYYRTSKIITKSLHQNEYGIKCLVFNLENEWDQIYVPITPETLENSEFVKSYEY